MSAEVTKKRGRPKKVISDPVDVEVPETRRKAIIRATSTKAAPPKSVKTPPLKHIRAAATTTPAKPAVSTSATLKVGSNLDSPIASNPKKPERTPQTNPTAPLNQTPTPKPQASAKIKLRSPVTPETSKILQKVRELPAKSSAGSGIPPDSLSPPSTKPSIQASTTSQPQAIPHQSVPIQGKSVSAASSGVSKSRHSPAPRSQTSSPPPPPPPVQRKAISIPAQPIKVPKPPPLSSKPASQIPLGALNSQIVSNIASQAGARPNLSASAKALPPNYKSVARKVTMTIVAMPILLVTSYILYQRLVWGEDQKHLVRPGMAMVEAPAADQIGERIDSVEHSDRV